MISVVSDWLALALLLCLAAWFAKRRIVVISLPIAVLLAAAAVWVPTGSARFTAPPAGDYKVVGADIVVSAYIDALLKPKDGPAVLYRLPYSTKAANDLQGAQDAGNGVKATVVGDGEGGVSYAGPPPVTGLPPKQPETPAITLP